MSDIDTGDTVYHKPSRETWRVACVRGDRLSWCGWPEGQANLADCELVQKAAPGEKEKLLQTLADMNNQDDHRCRFARYELGKTAAPPNEETK